MKIYIHCDGGAKLGTEHIIRQLMIAKELKIKHRK
jgi:spore coat polysaccharide biosynthesis predicted glycosyltransferase SpsG